MKRRARWVKFGLRLQGIQNRCKLNESWGMEDLIGLCSGTRINMLSATASRLLLGKKLQHYVAAEEHMGELAFYVNHYVITYGDGTFG